MVVGGNSKFEVPICLHSLARKRQSILGIHRGTREQLVELVDFVATGQVTGQTALLHSLFFCN